MSRMSVIKATCALAIGALAATSVIAPASAKVGPTADANWIRCHTVYTALQDPATSNKVECSIQATVSNLRIGSIKRINAYVTYAGATGSACTTWGTVGTVGRLMATYEASGCQATRTTTGTTLTIVFEAQGAKNVVLASTSVDSGWDPTSCGTHNYHLGIGTQQWVGAQWVAGVLGGYMAKANTAALQTCLAAFENNRQVWLGGNDRGVDTQWTWDGEGSPFCIGSEYPCTAQGGAYQAWLPGEPNGGTGENCMLSATSANVGDRGLWMDAGCDYYYPFIIDLP